MVECGPWCHTLGGHLHGAFIQERLSSMELRGEGSRQSPFVFIAGHRPMYAWEMMGGVSKSLRAAYEPLMQKYRVDAAFWGQQHTYQRTCSVRDLKCVSPGAGVVHFVSGAPGAGFIDVPFNEQIRPSWVAHAQNTKHGYVKGHVRGGDFLTLELYRMISLILY